jgi:GTP cyclohydrolase I
MMQEEVNMGRSEDDSTKDVLGSARSDALASMAPSESGAETAQPSGSAPASARYPFDHRDEAVAMRPVGLNDTQSELDRRNIPLDQVGIRDLRYPALVVGADGDCPTVATWELTVGLQPEQRGAHMSRLVASLEAWDRRITQRSLESFLTSLSHRLETERANVTLRFPYFRLKHAPVTGAKGLVDYEVTLSASLEENQIETLLDVVVPITSLCPCSKAISDRGAHNQRSHVAISATLADELWIDALIALVEEEASCQVYSLLKRDDEKYVTEHAYETPKFVEDLVRDVARRLLADSRFGHFSVTAENFESIHNHSAYAAVERPLMPKKLR